MFSLVMCLVLSETLLAVVTLSVIKQSLCVIIVWIGIKLVQSGTYVALFFLSKINWNGNFL
jgi:predicted tellurium resistance membrane protein TerC